MNIKIDNTDSVERQKIQCDIHGLSPYAEFNIDGSVELLACFKCYVDKLKEIGLKDYNNK